MLQVALVAYHGRRRLGARGDWGRRLLFKEEPSWDSGARGSEAKPVDTALVGAGLAGVALIVSFFALLALVDLVGGLIAG